MFSLILAFSVLLALGAAVARVSAHERNGKMVTEPESAKGSLRSEARTDGRNRRLLSGSVTVTVPARYRSHSAAYWAWRFRGRTRQLQIARHRISHLKQQLRSRHATRTLQSSPAGGLSYWIGRQIWAANQIGGHGTDPWPNCPDPFDGGGSWQDTVNCENGGNWYDSPGFYRCGLQFDPMWERKYGRLCP